MSSDYWGRMHSSHQVVVMVMEIYDLVRSSRNLNASQARRRSKAIQPMKTALRPLFVCVRARHNQANQAQPELRQHVECADPQR